MKIVAVYLVPLQTKKKVLGIYISKRTIFILLLASHFVAKTLEIEVFIEVRKFYPMRKFIITFIIVKFNRNALNTDLNPLTNDIVLNLSRSGFCDTSSSQN